VDIQLTIDSIMKLEEEAKDIRIEIEAHLRELGFKI
jgi:hypothetical protein